MIPSWCCQLCHVSRLRSLKRPDPEAKTAPPAPNLNNLDAFQLFFGSIGEPNLSWELGGHQVEHGLLWHTHLARRAAISVGEMRRWCRDPRTMEQPRSRAMATLTGLPLALLRPTTFGPEP